MMEQYLKIKEGYQNCILFYRLGDFYEMFFEDALTASRELEITLTGRECGLGERAPMCGIPFHAADGYVKKMIDKGYKVAICEQVEDPKLTKTIVRREVVRVITPGTVMDSNSLDETKNNYIMCVYGNKIGFSISVADITTGEFITSQTNDILGEVAKYNPAEIICNEYFYNQPVASMLEKQLNKRLDRYNEWAFEYATAYKNLCTHFSVLNLNGFGLEGKNLSTCTSGALIAYLSETQKNALKHIFKIKYYSTNEYMVLDLSSRRNLELTQTLREKEKKGTLLWVLDKTKTAMGARLLRKWVEEPLVDISKINKRLESVEEFKTDPLLREEIKEILNTVFDIERLMSKIVYTTANARDLVALKNSLANLPALKQLISTSTAYYQSEIYQAMDPLSDIYEMIEKSIMDFPPFSLREGGILKDGYDLRLDQLRIAKNEGTNWLNDLENAEKERTGIKNLKIRFNKIFGYYIEITNSNLNSAPENYIRKQTLANCERFITPELKSIEDAILGADEKIVELEFDIFCNIRNLIANEVNRIQETAYFIAMIDVLQSLGEVSDKQAYVKPVMNTEGRINIRNGRHPVVEKFCDNLFIPNDTNLDLEDNRLSIITGPNMAGKSTFMRQVALISIMAQIGSFVPAETADLCIVDRVFTRVGASDDLATGQSTFMIEMTEVANILNNATKNSLIILDEIGRGTSTFDGLSIAWAVVEYICELKNIGAKTLFATHYHELTELEGRLQGVKNYCIAVKEEGEDIIFLRKIIRGGTDNSYGIHVAKLAGVPRVVIERSNEILQQLNEADINNKTKNIAKTKKKPEEKINNNELEVIQELKSMDMNSMSPLIALQVLFDLQNKIK